MGNTLSNEKIVAKADRLQRRINRSVRYRAEKGGIHFVANMPQFTVRLPAFNNTPEGFERYILSSLIDENIQSELEASKAINWCRTLKKVYAISTPGDGNCLLHAISTALWGFHDSILVLRRLLYIRLVEDEAGELRSRWRRQQISVDQTQLEFQMTTMQWQTDWEQVVLSAEDRVQDYHPEHTALDSLQDIHIFVLANVIRRPIIVYCTPHVCNAWGSMLAPNHFGGLYLPLLWRPENCVKSPIILAYHCSHFVPLLSRRDQECSVAASEGAIHAVPLVTHDLMQRRVHFLSEDEDVNVNTILQTYLNISEVPLTTDDGVCHILAAKLEFRDIGEEFDLMSEYLEQELTAFTSGGNDPNMTAAAPALSLLNLTSHSNVTPWARTSPALSLPGPPFRLSRLSGQAVQEVVESEPNAKSTAVKYETRPESSTASYHSLQQRMEHQLCIEQESMSTITPATREVIIPAESIPRAPLKEATVKSFCATPGCHGKRSTKNECGLCDACYVYHYRSSSPLVKRRDVGVQASVCQTPPDIQDRSLERNVGEPYLCVTPGCNRYGDNSFEGLCSRCHSRCLLSAEYPTLPSTAITSVAPPSQPYVQAIEYAGPENLSELEHMKRDQKNRLEVQKTPCVGRGCQNFGNSKSHGFCNQCFARRLEIDNGLWQQ